MADRYVVQGLATGNNDGTSWANAWNNIENVIKNTGVCLNVIQPGDFVYAATHDGVSDLSYTFIENHTFAIQSPDRANPVNLIFDDGTKSDGTTTMPAGVFSFIQGQSARVIGGHEAFRVFGNNRLKIVGQWDPTNNAFGPQGVWQDVEVAVTGARQIRVGSAGEVRNLTIKPSTYVTPQNHGYLMSGISSEAVFINPVIDMANCTAVGEMRMFGWGAQYTQLTVRGGELKNCTVPFPLFQSLPTNTQAGVYYSLMMLIDGFKIPASPTFTSFQKAPPPIYQYKWQQRNARVVMNGGVYPNDFMIGYSAGFFMWEENKNYPVRDAQLTDGVTNYSIAIHSLYADKHHVIPSPDMRKRYVSASAQRTITAQLIFDNRILAPKDSEYWLEIAYISDTTGKMVIESTEAELAAGVTLATSTATWSTENYNGGLSKWQIQHLTNEPIRQGTEIRVTLMVAGNSNDAGAFTGFLDPDFAVT